MWAGRSVFLHIILIYWTLVCGEDVLPGHMQRIGSHRPPEEGLAVLTRVPDPVEFYEEYVEQSKPVVLRGAIANTPQLTLWLQDDYLSSTYGKEEVMVEVGKKEDRNGNALTLSFADFLERYKSEDIYLVNGLLPGMNREWFVPRCLLCGGFTDYINFVYMWFSSGGTKSVLHTDSYENLHCLVSGLKEFVLIPPKYSTTIGPEHADQGYYNLDVEKVNMTSHPGMMEVPWYEVTVEPGDCLYIPYMWIHHVTSHGRNFGSNIWWSWFKFQRDLCPADPNSVPEFKPLSDFTIRPEAQILSLFEKIERNDGYVYSEDLLKEDIPMVNKQLADELLDILEPGCNGKLNLAKMNTISPDQFAAIKELMTTAPTNGQGSVEDTVFGGISEQMDYGDDGIELPSSDEVNRYLQKHAGTKATNHNEL